MYCNAVRGDEVFKDGEDDGIERGLWPVGVRREKDGMKGPVGSGVFGGSGGGVDRCEESSKVAELIHFSSRVFPGGESV